MTVYAYLRVSTTNKGQTTENQLLAIQQSGMHVDEYVSENISGTIRALKRVKFAEMFSKLKKGDSVVCTMTDRFGRNAEDVLNTLNTLQAMGVKAYILHFGTLDLTSTMGKMIVTVMAAMAEMEKAILSERTIDGLERTKAQGTRVGRPWAIAPDDMDAIVSQQAQGCSLDVLSAKYGYERNTISRKTREWKNDVQGYRKEYFARQEQYTRARVLRAA